MTDKYTKALEGVQIHSLEIVSDQQYKAGHYTEDGDNVIVDVYYFQVELFNGKRYRHVAASEDLDLQRERLNIMRHKISEGRYPKLHRSDLWYSVAPRYGSPAHDAVGDAYLYDEDDIEAMKQARG